MSRPASLFNPGVVSWIVKYGGHGERRTLHGDDLVVLHTHFGEPREFQLRLSIQVELQCFGSKHGLRVLGEAFLGGQFDAFVDGNVSRCL